MANGGSFYAELPKDSTRVVAPLEELPWGARSTWRHQQEQLQRRETLRTPEERAALETAEAEAQRTRVDQMMAGFEAAMARAGVGQQPLTTAPPERPQAAVAGSAPAFPGMADPRNYSTDGRYIPSDAEITPEMRDTALTRISEAAAARRGQADARADFDQRRYDLARDDFERRRAGIGDAGSVMDEFRKADLRSKLAALDRQFPVPHDRFFTPRDLAWGGPFPSLGRMKGTGMRPVRNPITGTLMDLPPGVPGSAVLQPANAMVEAKARARGDLIRGKGVEDAMVEALAGAAGMDPAMLRGMGLGQAQALMGPLQQQQAEAQEGERRQQLQGGFEAALGPEVAGQVAGIENPTDASSILRMIAQQMQAEQEMQAERAKGEREGQIATNLEDATRRLMEMDPDAALAQAPSAIAGLVEPGSERYARVMNMLGSRAERQRQTAMDAQARSKEIAAARQKEEEGFAKERERRDKDIDARILTPLRKALAISPKVVKVKKGEGILATEEEGFSWREGVGESLAELKRALAEAEADPEIGPRLGPVAQMIRAARVEGGEGGLWDEKDPEGVARTIGDLASMLMRAIVEAQRGG